MMLKVYILIIVVGFVGSVAYGGYYYKNELLSKLRKINLSKLSAEEPAVWEGKINDASKRLLEDFESITAYPSAN